MQRQNQEQRPRRQLVSDTKPPPPQAKTAVAAPLSPVDPLFPLFEDMKKRILSVEMLWVRVKQLEVRLETNELYLNRLNGRISNWQRRQDRTVEVEAESQDGLVILDPIQDAEVASIRQHSVQKLSVQQLAQQTTTSQT